MCRWAPYAKAGAPVGTAPKRNNVGPGKQLERRIPQKPPNPNLISFKAGGNIVEPMGEPLDHGGDAALDGFRPGLARRGLGANQGFSYAPELVMGLRELVRDQEPDHHQHACLRHQPDRAIKLGRPLVEIGGEPNDVLLLPVIARNRVCAAANTDRHLAHDQPPTSARISVIAWLSRLATASPTTRAAA